jgi:quercetin dioxygenase-like cupin family protein
MAIETAFELGEAAARARLNSRTAPLASLDGLEIGVSRFSKHPRWEIHPNGEEFLQVIEGVLDLTLLTEDGPQQRLLQPGSAVVVPRNTWHSPVPKGTVVLLHIADYRGTRVSNAARPK